MFDHSDSSTVVADSHTGKIGRSGQPEILLDKNIDKIELIDNFTSRL